MQVVGGVNKRMHGGGEGFDSTHIIGNSSDLRRWRLRNCDFDPICGGDEATMHD